MRVAMLTREWPPDIYGGAGVHVDFLARELRSLVDLEVHCFGPSRDGAVGHEPDPQLATANPALRTLSVDLAMASAVDGADVLHSHTWYANLGGQIGGLLHGAPHVMTAHSLEPDRPWKVEQLGGGYHLSSWVERSAYEGASAIIAVSEGMRVGIQQAYPFVDPERIHVVYNGIDTVLYHPDPDTNVLVREGIDPERPYVIFVGRITRQKGVAHLVRAAHAFDPDTQVVLCAGAPDTKEIGAEIAELVRDLQASRDGVLWIEQMLPRTEVVQLLSHARAFVCPSVYEPLGIVNLEAMACRTPVVASNVGGIPEVVVEGETGLLVPYEAEDAQGFEAGLALAVNELVRDAARAREMGEAGRRRAVEDFGWAAIARDTVDVYESVLARN
ncbi:MAG TPA: glycogen synthase [Actinomycetes bacterium]|nr:glycogen synthase [Actinomycetes bacterium]